MIRAIDRLFDRLAATYGAEWERSLGHTPMTDAKTIWAHELSVFKHSLNRIAWALENLPDRCPNVIVFKSLCRQAPTPQTIALPEPKADPARVATELAKLAPLRARSTAHTPIDDKAWARTILINHKGGLKINQTSLKMARDALGANT